MNFIVCDPYLNCGEWRDRVGGYKNLLQGTYYELNK